MASTPDELREMPPTTPAPPELVERATALVRNYPECFWFRHPEARIRHLEDARLVLSIFVNTAIAELGVMLKNCINACLRLAKMPPNFRAAGKVWRCRSPGRSAGRL